MAALVLSTNLAPAYSESFGDTLDAAPGQSTNFFEAFWNSVTGKGNRQKESPQSSRLPNGYFNVVSSASPVTNLPNFDGTGSGSLEAVDPAGKKLGTCALKHTDVKVRVSGFVASVYVKQLFQNPYKQKIEAQYTFPLSSTGAVDDMTMRIGSRIIRGTIKKKQEAHQIYNQAKAEGHVASLLDQEKPNIFTQYVANIEPGKDIEVTIHYVDVLPFESGFYTFAFPTVVGPRFTPSGAQIDSGKLNTTSASLSNVTESSTLTPAYKDGAAGHGLSLSVDIDAGVPVKEIFCPLHTINVNPLSNATAHIELSNKKERPNRDFILSWKASGEELKGGYFTERTGKSGYLSMMLLPPARVSSSTAAPKEMIFLVDRSGSQSGAPLEKAKETLSYIVDRMNPEDTFQILSFSNSVSTLFSKPEKASSSMKAEAKKYISKLYADGGTFMAPAVKSVCAMPAEANRLRIVTFMTDGYVGNDMEVLSLVKETRGRSRWFSFGTGNSVNRFLIDKIAEVGGGEPEIVELSKSGAEVAKKFYDRISSPVLTDVKVKFEGIEVTDVMPTQVSDVWAEKPLYVHARYTRPGIGKVILEGYSGGKPYKKAVEVKLPNKTDTGNSIAQIWARAAVDELMALDWFGVESGRLKPELKSLIEELGVRYHIMTQFTSFVAVDKGFKTSAAQAVTVDVPAEVPEGVSLQAVLNGGSINLPSSSAGAAIENGTTLPAVSVQSAPQTGWQNAASMVPSFGKPFLSSSGSGGCQSFGDAFSSQAVMGEVSGGNNTFYNTGVQEPRPSGGPILQGASNGAIGPQGFDATSIMGVNTAGSVSVGNLGSTNANVLASGDLVVDYLKLAFLFLGLVASARGIARLCFKRNGAKKLLLLGGAWIALSQLYWPALIPWCLWLLAGDCAGLLARKFAWARAKNGSRSTIAEREMAEHTETKEKVQTGFNSR